MRTEAGANPHGGSLRIVRADRHRSSILLPLESFLLQRASPSPPRNPPPEFPFRPASEIGKGRFAQHPAGEATLRIPAGSNPALGRAEAPPSGRAHPRGGRTW